jgi:hypothetical protein
VERIHHRNAVSQAAGTSLKFHESWKMQRKQTDRLLLANNAVVLSDLLLALSLLDHLVESVLHLKDGSFGVPSVQKVRGPTIRDWQDVSKE